MVLLIEGWVLNGFIVELLGGLMVGGVMVGGWILNGFIVELLVWVNGCRVNGWRWI